MIKLERQNIADKNLRTLKVLQFGGGNFMRAFVDWMVQRMNDKCDYNAGVVLVKPTAGGNYTGLLEQDGLFHVVTSGFAKGKVIDEIELITCIDRIIQPYDDFHSFIDSARLPDLRVVVSNTTESGIVYQYEQTSAQPSESFPGKLCQWLKARFEHFSGAQDKGCIILPCELIESNGHTLKEIVKHLARDWSYGDDFIKWLENDNFFCNTLVDRIVPGKPDPETLKRYEQQTGFTDEQLVVGEPYHLWAIEGPDWLESEFPLQKAGVKAVWTDDLSDYRLQKVRLLNGGHTAMVPVGLLSGISTVGEFVKDPVLGIFLKRLMIEEIIPSIKGVEQRQLHDYAEDVLDRFRNPFVKHRLSSIALNSLSKFVVRILPSIDGFLQNEGRLPERLILSFAALIRFYKGTINNVALPVKDHPELIKVIQEKWQEKSEGKINLVQLSEGLLSNKKLWGRNLNEIPNLKLNLAGALEIIERGDLANEIKRLS